MSERTMEKKVASEDVRERVAADWSEIRERANVLWAVLRENGYEHLRDALVGQHSDAMFYGQWERHKALLRDLLDVLDAVLRTPCGEGELDESEIPVRCTCEWESPMTGEVDARWPHVLDPYCRVHGAPGGSPEPCRCVPVEGELNARQGEGGQQ